MTHSLKLHDDAILLVAELGDDAVAAQLAALQSRLPLVLPARCLLEVIGDGTAKATPQRARQELARCEAAVAALGQSSSALCLQQDSLNLLHSFFVREARSCRRKAHTATGVQEVARRLEGHVTWHSANALYSMLASLTWARMEGLRSVLLAQLDREFEVRNGRPISPDLKLPVGSGGGGGGEELELVPVEPETEDPEDGSDGGGGGGGAAPAVVVAAMPLDSTDPDADVDHGDDDDGDGLDFLDLDRGR